MFCFLFSYYSNNDLRHITVFASPALSRRHRNVYKQPDKFWLLAQVEGREDQEAISKIDQLQKQVIKILVITKSQWCDAGECVPAPDKENRKACFIPGHGQVSS